MMYRKKLVVFMSSIFTLSLFYCSDDRFDSEFNIKPYFGTTVRYACDINNPPKVSEPPCDVDAFRLCAYSEKLNSIICNEYSVEEGKSGVKFKLPEAEDYRIFFQGYNKSKPDLMLWCGATEKVSLKKGDNKDISVFIGRCSDFVFTRNKMSVPRAFHTATLLNDGRVLIVGGISSVSSKSCDPDCDGRNCKPYCRLAESTDIVEIYDYKKGEFEKIGKLNIPRALHTATLMKDGRVIIAGGSKSIRLYTFFENDKPFLLPENIDEASSSIEIFDPQTNTIKKVQGGVSRTMHSSYMSPDGKIYAIGGLSDNSWNYESNIAEISPDQGFIDSKISLTHGRVLPVIADFSIVDIGSASIVILGGMAIDETKNIGNSFDIISFSDAKPSVKEHKYSTREAFILASLGSNILPVDSGKFILMGGMMMRDFKLGFSGSEINIFANNPLDYSYYFDMNNNNVSYPSRNSNMLYRRAFSQSVYLHSKSPKILVAGGFESVNPDVFSDSSFIPFIPSSSVELFLLNSELFDSIHPEGIVDAANPVVKMNMRRACHTLTTLPDQTILITGGFSSGDEISNTSEIFEPYTSNKDASLLVY